MPNKISGKNAILDVICSKMPNKISGKKEYIFVICKFKERIISINRFEYYNLKTKNNLTFFMFFFFF